MKITLFCITFHKSLKLKLKLNLLIRLQEKFGTNFIKGVKDSSGDINQTSEYLKSNNIMTTVGDERLIARTLKLGGDGSICGLSNIYPNEISDVIKTKKNNQHINKMVNKILKYPVVPAIKTLIIPKNKK